MGGPGKDFTADYTDFTDKHLPSLTQSRKGAKAQRGKAATKGFEQEQTEETEKETESRKIFVENAQLWWMALQRRKEMAHKLDMRLPGSCDFAPLRLCVKTLPHGCGLWRGLSWV